MSQYLITFSTGKMAQIFGPLDYVIMAATMIASIGIGVYFRFTGGKQKTNEVTYSLVLLSIR